MQFVDSTPQFLQLKICPRCTTADSPLIVSWRETTTFKQTSACSTCHDNLSVFEEYDVANTVKYLQQRTNGKYRRIKLCRNCSPLYVPLSLSWKNPPINFGDHNRGSGQHGTCNASTGSSPCGAILIELWELNIDTVTVQTPRFVMHKSSLHQESTNAAKQAHTSKEKLVEGLKRRVDDSGNTMSGGGLPQGSPKRQKVTHPGIPRPGTPTSPRHPSGQSIPTGPRVPVGPKASLNGMTKNVENSMSQRDQNRHDASEPPKASTPSILISNTVFNTFKKDSVYTERNARVWNQIPANNIAQHHRVAALRPVVATPPRPIGGIDTGSPLHSEPDLQGRLEPGSIELAYETHRTPSFRKLDISEHPLLKSLNGMFYEEYGYLCFKPGIDPPVPAEGDPDLYIDDKGLLKVKNLL